MELKCTKSCTNLAAE